MDIVWPRPGKYIVAVSGGVDSVVLLDALARKGGYDLVVAHADHGIRSDSAADAQLVEQLADQYGYNNVKTKLNLSATSSEDAMRDARYDFLRNVMKDNHAQAIITGHHLDDVLETSIMNVRRGTDRYGAAGGMTRSMVMRPLITCSKNEIVKYAKTHNLPWREDSTNTDTRYARNYIRHELLPKINRAAYLQHLFALQEVNDHIDVLLNGRTSYRDGAIVLDRDRIAVLGLRELEVLLAYAIRQQQPDIELSQPNISRLAREVLLDTTKNSFSYAGADGIIVTIQ